MTTGVGAGGGEWLRSGVARQRALGILGEGGALAPSPDGAAIAYAVLALADAIDGAGRRIGADIEQMANSLEASMTELGRHLDALGP